MAQIARSTTGPATAGATMRAAASSMVWTIAASTATTHAGAYTALSGIRDTEQRDRLRMPNHARHNPLKHGGVMAVQERGNGDDDVGPSEHLQLGQTTVGAEHLGR